MPKLEHWIIASRALEVLNRETTTAILGLEGRVGEGWCEVHQHICVNPYNKEKIEGVLRATGFTVSYGSDRRIRHPEIHPECLHDHGDDISTQRMERCLMASKMVEVLPREALKAIVDLGGHIAGGWCEIHQHVYVNQDNQEKIQGLLCAAGFTVSYMHS